MQDSQMQAQQMVMAWAGKIPEESTLVLQERISKATDTNKVASLSMLPLKTPVVGLVLGLFFGGFGADRFYKGNIGLGVLKLLGISAMWIFAFIFGAMTTFAGAAVGDEEGAAVGAAMGFGLMGIVWLIVAIWVIADLFLVWKGIKKDNFDKINNQLLMLGL